MAGSVLSFLGLIQRAGKLATGEETVIKAIQAQTAKHVIIASDASASTRKKVTDKCTFYQIPWTILTDRATIGRAIGKEARVTLAILDEGFAVKFRSYE
ncbi:YlxQ family RNA-binding protein [Salisediminibacterium halotolerans]|uniref:Ribosomal protein L7Ae n=1 Tax=Salisediminibacterium halotolerans TaxID=517425 RepID=A0A1H9Q9F9_9BACI|nr:MULTISPECIES: YlxQ family RNA-binding protein [Salisediminibacterium]RLJ74178.1 ribosomal protein L7Ae-like RNA K-turn-binding protein [Actinophytocola xinjiangensis]RPE87729.1 ribosomal protein L7Ae-like RNA K-turn-binding protein [Salisediminibacterium halotolerans]TWG35015.1 ribosomal protein L7Ae-like RNA K-turn-binding protein [Salisediminibacterium halotolerans]SER56785.1 Ribosomal protein L7Ae [Salisediminibacterium haloalkalitolerans]GEL06698.1 putative ribosomal protein YlxQ [Salis